MYYDTAPMQALTPTADTPTKSIRRMRWTETTGTYAWLGWRIWERSGGSQRTWWWPARLGARRA
eukprot:535404-Rhodomonas_salina.2